MAIGVVAGCVRVCVCEKGGVGGLEIVQGEGEGVSAVEVVVMVMEGGRKNEKEGVSIGK